MDEILKARQFYEVRIVLLLEIVFSSGNFFICDWFSRLLSLWLLVWFLSRLYKVRCNFSKYHAKILIKIK